MGVTECNIHLDQRKDDYIPGDIVSGKVNYILVADAEFKEISLTLNGRGLCRWSERHGKQTVTYVGKEKYFTQTIELLNEKTSDDKVTLAAGPYTHCFQFMLPENIPHTYRIGPHFISYCLKIVFVRPDFWKRKQQFKTEILVAAHVDINSDVYTTGRNPTTAIVKRPIYKLFTKDGYVVSRVHLPRTVYLPGEQIQLEYEVDNNTTLALPLPGLKTKLFREITLTSQSGHTNVFRKSVYKAPQTGVIHSKQQQMPILGEVSIPSNIEPVLLHSAVIRVSYLLRVTVRVPGMRRNSFVEIPLVIGTAMNPLRPLSEAGPSSSSASALYSSPPPTYYAHTDDLPPSYWKVMQMDEIDDENDYK